MKATEITRVIRLCLLKSRSVTHENQGGETKESISNVQNLVDDVNLVQESDLTITTLCSLWAGKGHIYKVSVNNNNHNEQQQQPKTFIVKHIVAPKNKQTSLGDIRKAISYEVEANFYDKLATKLITNTNLSIPKPYYIEHFVDGSIIICMSYIKENNNIKSLSDEHIKQVLIWLATFHSTYWGTNIAKQIVTEIGLHPIGSYWYLDTRPDEYNSMPTTGWEGRLRLAAHAIDNQLHNININPYQCLIHGDVKPDNVLIINKTSIAMCDFQYCGMAPPTIDLAYFFCTGIRSSTNVEQYVDFYYNELIQRLPDDVSRPTRKQLNDSLDLAYCDFYRFMSGWGFWGSGGEDRVKGVLDKLDGGKKLKSEQDYYDAVQREYGNI